MGLDSAIYEPTTQKIFGVRGQWLYRFSSVTGSLEASLRVCNQARALSCITAMGGNLYVGVTFVANTTMATLSTWPNRDIYKVNAAAFTVTGPLGLTAHIQFHPGTKIPDYWTLGWNALVNDGTKLYGVCNDGDVFSVDPTNIAGYARTSFGVVSDITYDSTNNALWIPEVGFPSFYAIDKTNLANFALNSGTPAPTISGITFCAAQNKIYFSQGDFNIGMINAASAFPGPVGFAFTTFNTGRINSTSVKLKAVNNQVGNPHNGKILMPTFDDDAVVIWNPATDVIESVQTGFSSPFDIVVCPTANFAVQTSSIGLKIIT